MSAPGIRIELGNDGKELLRRLENLPFIQRKAIARGMDKAAALTVSDIQAQRLTGKGPFPVPEHKLGIVTNRLRASLRATKAEVRAESVQQTIGTNVRYAAVHEFGFNGQVQVPAHTRRVKSRDQHEVRSTVSKKTGKPRKSKVRVASGLGYVKAHVRWMQMPARAPIGHGLADNAGTYTREVTGAMREAVKAHVEHGGEAR